jgi:ABC-2 type transport system ATP-binding protein
MRPVLSFHHVSKQFGVHTVINDMSFALYPRELVALLGVNGAGKTTTIHMAVGLEKPSKGTITLFGGSPSIPKNRSKIGMTFQTTQLPENLTVREIIELIQAHYIHPLTLQETAEKFGLQPLLERRAGLLSEGQKRRVALALAFIGRPELLFLDEPTVGLDVESRKKVWQVLQEYVLQGGTILLTTHYLEEAERLATRILILDHGTITHAGTVEEIKKIKASGVDEYTKVSFDSPSDPSIILGPEVVHTLQKSNDHYIITTADADALVREIVKSNLPFKNLQITRKTLEDAFVHLSQEHTS